MKEDNLAISVPPTGKYWKMKREYFFLIAGVISLILGILTAIDYKSTFIVISALFFFIILSLKKEFSVYLIILVLFFEAHVFSFNFLGARIRFAQIIEVIAIFVFLFLILLEKVKLKKTPLDLFLGCYILINFISLINAFSLDRSIKIGILLISLVLLYYVIVNFLSKKEIFEKAFNILLYVGIAEMIYGLYQVFAGICQNYLSINLPIGHAGIMHQEFLTSQWGRPYGTFVEPDWFGAVSMFYAILFIVLYSSDSHKKKKLYLAGMILSLLGMIFSFVRASWLGFFGGLILILLLRNKWNLSKLKFNFFYKIIYSFFFFGLILFISSPSFNSIIKNRFTTKGLASISISNFRFVMGEYAIKSFLKHPIIGNGPGSPLVREGTKEYHEAIEAEQAYIIEGNFNPGLLTTLLKDTGIIGTLVFLFLFAKFFRYNLRNIPRLENHYQVISFAFFCGIFGLFISFLLTHGFWMPFTWVFLGFNIVSIRMGLKDKGA